MKPYYEQDGITIYHGDCRDILPTLEKVDLVLTSPPYDNLRDYGGYEFDFNVISSMLYEGVVNGGIVVWVVGDATINGSETGTSFRQALRFMDVGFNLHDTMIFQKANAMPLNHNRYDPCFEYMFVFSKGKVGTFNPIMDKTKYEGLIKKRYLEAKSNLEPNSCSRQRGEETTVGALKLRKNIWCYSVGTDDEGKVGCHPAPFPSLLATDHIISWSNDGDIILDPFLGSGTTAEASMYLQRKCTGIEIEEKYCEIAAKRCSQGVFKLNE